MVVDHDCEMNFMNQLFLLFSAKKILSLFGMEIKGRTGMDDEDDDE